MTTLKGRSFLMRFERALDDGARLTKSEVNALKRAAGGMRAPDEKAAAKELLALVEHDRELDEVEVGKAKEALRQLLGQERGRLPRALERLLAKALPACNVRVADYDLSFDVSERGAEEFPARARLTLEESARGRVVLEVDPERVVVDEVRAGGRSVAFAVKSGRLTFAGDGAKTLDVRYRVKVSDDVESYGLIRDRHSGNLWTLTWPYHTGALFPSSSDPSDGATATVRIKAEREARLVAAGARTGDSFRLDEPVPSYAIAFYAGEFSEQKESVHEHEHRVRSHGHKQKLSPEVRKAYRKHAALALAYFGAWLGPYRHGARLEAVEVKGELGGMEHAGAFALMVDGRPGKRAAAETAVHETAHQWFGDGVRIAAWNDFWMSEGFTNYATYRFFGHKDGDKALFRLFDRAKEAVREAIKDKPHGLHAGEHVDVRAIFTDIPYEQGPWMLRMMEGMVGTARFDAFLRDWYRAHRGAAVTTQTFLDFAEEELGRDFSSFFEAWNKLEALPTLKDRSRIEGSAVHLELEAKTKLPAGLELPVEIVGARGEKRTLRVSPGRPLDLDVGFTVRSIKWDPQRYVLADVV